MKNTEVAGEVRDVKQVLGEKAVEIGEQYRARRQAGEEFPTKESLRPLVEGVGAEFVGVGQDSIVFRATEIPGKVIAINRYDQSPELAEEIYLLQNIAATLFPHNFPKFYASVVDAYGYGGTVRQEITGESIDLTMVKKSRDSSDQHVRFHLSQVIQVMRELELPLSFDFDDPNNFRLGPDGGVYCLDPVDKSPGKWNVEKIVQFMRDKKNSAGELTYTENGVAQVTT